MCKVMAVLIGAFLMTAGFVFAQPSPAVAQAAVQSVEVGNKHCPISGKEVGVMGPAFKIGYKGKVYNLCCPGCVNTFNSDPEKFSKIAEADAALQSK